MIEKDFKDRIPTHPGRVLLLPVDGQANMFTMSKADEPTEEGTPLNKDAFNSIIQSRLTGRFYEPTVTRIEVNSRNGVTVNPIPNSGWNNVTLTQATSGEYTIKASSSLNDSYTLEKATDGNQNTEWTSKGYLNNNAEWWQIQLPTPIAVTAFKANLEDLSGYGQTFIFQGSTNGTSWENLTSGSFSKFTGMLEYTFSNTVQYSYYRMYFTGYEEYSAVMVEFVISRYNITIFSNKYVLSSGVPDVWSTGQRITIQTPADVSTAGTVSNTLNGITINTILLPSKKYELVYNGTSFVAKEL